MREEEIQRALEFLKSAPVKNIALEEKSKFLEEKLTQEELQEVKKRFQSGETKPTVKIVNSKQTKQRL
jgi:hypothetical protein